MFTTWLRIKNGYPLETSWGKPLHPKTDRESMERIKLLTGENAQLRAELGSVKDRLETIERIVTDQPHRLARGDRSADDRQGRARLMDKAILVIGFFLVVVGIPVIAGVLGDMYKRRFKLREKELELLGAQTAEKAAQYASRSMRARAAGARARADRHRRGVETAAQIEALARPSG